MDMHFLAGPLPGNGHSIIDGGKRAGMAALPLATGPIRRRRQEIVSHVAKLQRLHAAAGQLAEDAPAVIAHPEAARGLEQALIGAMVECLCRGRC